MQLRGPYSSFCLHETALLGMLASSKKFMRSLPGRLIGRTRDTEGRNGGGTT